MARLQMVAQAAARAHRGSSAVGRYSGSTGTAAGTASCTFSAAAAMKVRRRTPGFFKEAMARSTGLRFLEAATTTEQYLSSRRVEAATLSCTTSPPTAGWVAGPQAELIQGSDGALYGTTSGGGSNYSGTVFKLNTDGSGHVTLHSFTFGDGRPRARLVEGGDGVLYGTTPEGGSNHFGSVFKLNKDGGGYIILHSFNYNGVDGVR